MRLLLPLALLGLVFFFTFKKQCTGNIAAAPPRPPADTVLIVLDHFQFDTLLNTQRNVILIDLRSAGEFAEGHIWRSTSMDATDSLFYNRLLALGKENTFALYCSNGNTGGEVGQKMKADGFKKIYVLRDGLLKWSDTGRALQLH